MFIVIHVDSRVFMMILRFPCALFSPARSAAFSVHRWGVAVRCRPCLGSDSLSGRLRILGSSPNKACNYRPIAWCRLRLSVIEFFASISLYLSYEQRVEVPGPPCLSPDTSVPKDSPQLILNSHIICSYLSYDISMWHVSLLGKFMGFHDFTRRRLPSEVLPNRLAEAVR